MGNWYLFLEHIFLLLFIMPSSTINSGKEKMYLTCYKLQSCNEDLQRKDSSSWSVTIDLSIDVHTTFLSIGLASNILNIAPPPHPLIIDYLIRPTKNLRRIFVATLLISCIWLITCSLVEIDLKLNWYFCSFPARKSENNVAVINEVKAYHAQAKLDEVETILAEGPPKLDEHQDISSQMCVLAHLCIFWAFWSFYI